MLSVLLAVCITVFTEQRIEAFVPQVKNFAEIKLGESLGVGSGLSIGSIKGGILHPIILNDIRISDSKGATVASSVDIESVKTNYRIWDVLFKTGNVSAVSIDFSARNNGLKGHVTIRGGINDSRVNGILEMAYFGEVSFNGSIKGPAFDGVFESQKGTVRASGLLSDDGSMSIDFKAEHLKLGDFDIVCDARSKFYTNAGKEKDVRAGWRGEFQTRNLVLNYRPFPDIKVSYGISDGNLIIDEASIGDMLRLTGKVLLDYPNNMETVVLANNVSLSWLFITLGASDASDILTGTMNGKFELKGPVNKMRMSARIDIRKGTMGGLDFEALSATMKGDLPYLRIEDARITRQSGFFTLEGEMDMTKIGKNAFFDNIKLSSDDKAINWDGWKTAQVQDVQEIRMNKRINDDINIDFKQFVADDKIDESIKDNNEVGFEYKLHPKDSLKMVVDKEGEFLGLEHKDKF